MPAIINSAPDCVQHLSGATKGDVDDFVVGAAYQKCEGIMTFGHGSTYGDGGHGATTAYYVLQYVGIVVTVAMLVAWVIAENRTLREHALRLRRPAADPTPTAPDGV